MRGKGAPVSRRTFLAGAALGGGALWLGVPWRRLAAAQEDEPSRPVFGDAEASTFEAIAARIIPAGDGPGAREAGCLGFAEQALAGPEEASAGLVRAGLVAVGAAAYERYGRRFPELRAEEQDEMIGLLDSGEIGGWRGGTDPRRFFATVRGLVILGFLADPEYGGNRGGAGWQAVGFPASPHDEGHTEAQLHGRQRVIPIWERPRRLPPGA